MAKPSKKLELPPTAKLTITMDFKYREDGQCAIEYRIDCPDPVPRELVEDAWLQIKEDLLDGGEVSTRVPIAQA